MPLKLIITYSAALGFFSFAGNMVFPNPGTQRYKIPVFTLKNRPKNTQNRPVLWGNNPMVGATVACAVAVEEAMK